MVLTADLSFLLIHTHVAHAHALPLWHVGNAPLESLLPQYSPTTMNEIYKEKQNDFIYEKQTPSCEYHGASMTDHFLPEMFSCVVAVVCFLIPDL